MVNGIIIKLLIGTGLMSFGNPTSQELCSGFLPENDLRIPVNSVLSADGFTIQGIEKKQFDLVLDRIEKFYGPIVSAKGGQLRINRNWTSDTVNASAQRFGDSYILNMFGGLARHDAITDDGFSLVACHEMGHHIGGYPKIGGFFGAWATNEGQADYFATLKCLRRIWPAEETEAVMAEKEVPTVVENSCLQVWSDAAEQNLCMRLALAGFSVSSLFKDLRDSGENPKFDTPDPAVVAQTYNKHPLSQCRLDTYFQGALCHKDIDDGVSATDPKPGTCVRSANAEIGIRPLCWYAP